MVAGEAGVFVAFEDAVSLSEIREQIDKIDKQTIVLLSKRAGPVTAAGKLKKDEHGVLRKFI